MYANDEKHYDFIKKYFKGKKSGGMRMMEDIRELLFGFIDASITKESTELIPRNMIATGEGKSC